MSEASREKIISIGEMKRWLFRVWKGFTDCVYKPKNEVKYYDNPTVQKYKDYKKQVGLLYGTADGNTIEDRKKNNELIYRSQLSRSNVEPQNAYEIYFTKPTDINAKGEYVPKNGIINYINHDYWNIAYDCKFHLKLLYAIDSFPSAHYHDVISVIPDRTFLKDVRSTITLRDGANKTTEVVINDTTNAISYNVKDKWVKIKPKSLDEDLYCEFVMSTPTIINKGRYIEYDEDDGKYYNTYDEDDVFTSVFPYSSCGTDVSELHYKSDYAYYAIPLFNNIRLIEVKYDFDKWFVNNCIYDCPNWVYALLHKIYTTRDYELNNDKYKRISKITIKHNNVDYVVTETTNNVTIPETTKFPKWDLVDGLVSCPLKGRSSERMNPVQLINYILAQTDSLYDKAFSTNIYTCFGNGISTVLGCQPNEVISNDMKEAANKYTNGGNKKLVFDVYIGLWCLMNREGYMLDDTDTAVMYHHYDGDEGSGGYNGHEVCNDTPSEISFTQPYYKRIFYSYIHDYNVYKTDGSNEIDVNKKGSAYWFEDTIFNQSDAYELTGQTDVTQFKKIVNYYNKTNGTSSGVVESEAKNEIKRCRKNEVYVSVDVNNNLTMGCDITSTNPNGVENYIKYNSKSKYLDLCPTYDTSARSIDNVYGFKDTYRAQWKDDREIYGIENGVLCSSYDFYYSYNNKVNTGNTKQTYEHFPNKLFIGDTLPSYFVRIYNDKLIFGKNPTDCVVTKDNINNNTILSSNKITINKVIRIE